MSRVIRREATTQERHVHTMPIGFDALWRYVFFLFMGLIDAKNACAYDLLRGDDDS
jgi:hypothetical protein